MLDYDAIAADYRRNGFVAIERFLPEGLRAELQAETNSKVAAGRHATGSIFDTQADMTGGLVLERQAAAT